MHHILPKNLTTTLADISAPRLSSYRVFFNPKTDEELYGIYCWNDAISIRFMRLIGIIEIILRNRFHIELSSFAYRTESYGTKQSNNWYRYIVKHDSDTAKQLVKKITKLDRSILPSKALDSNIAAHKVIAGMTNGFWPYLLKIKYDLNGNLIPWEDILPKMFPSHPQKLPSYWSSQHNVNKMISRLLLINDMRNRIAHLEPLWKFQDLKDEWLPSKGHTVNVVSPAPANSIDAIARLRLIYDRAMHLLSWLSKDRLTDYCSSETHANLDWLLSIEALDSYKNIGTENTIRLSSLTKSWGGKLELRNRRSALILDKSIPVGRYYSLNGTR